MNIAIATTNLARTAPVFVVCLLITVVAAAGEWTMLAQPDTIDAPHPRVACTPVELARLRAAWRGKASVRRPRGAHRRVNAEPALRA